MPELHPRIASFLYAGRGLAVLLRQPHARFHLVAAAVVVALAAYLRVSPGEWLALILAITLVLAAEALNTAIEHVVDIASPEWSALARDAKDVAAAGVLICALGALCVGGVVFLPRLI